MYVTSVAKKGLKGGFRQISKTELGFRIIIIQFGNTSTQKVLFKSNDEGHLNFFHEKVFQ